MKRNLFSFFGLLIVCLILSGCRTTTGNVGNISNYAFPLNLEAEWIRNGEPLEFEGELWYPQDSVNILIDSEVYLVGEHNEVQFFIEKVDVRPYGRLYTKFGRNKYRIFKKITK